ncbi:MAG TPA: hypothetical protein VFO26_02115 [Gaiella sp.]|uniref:hypothetical protein n=1 Tax=Gaiella sp. TaxID=2663207 RepID=UPI002D7E1BB8|nr:hypothetical protein [Gaiella sp.]HET9286329.1 hypothetical protein [Gaiella sp.]
MNARMLMVLLIAVAALVAAGCGGDDSNEAGGDATDAAVVTETSGDDSGDDTTDDMTGTSDDDELGDLSEECQEFAGISAKLGQSLSGGTAGLDEAAEVFDEIADQVPEEIRDDYRVVADNFAEIAEALKGVDLTSGATDPETIAKLQELGQTLDSAEVREATENLEAWARENC